MVCTAKIAVELHLQVISNVDIFHVISESSALFRDIATTENRQSPINLTLEITQSNGISSPYLFSEY